MEIFDLPPMLKGNEQDLPNLRNYLIRLGDEIKRITNDLSAIESIEKIVKNTEFAIKYTEESLNTKQNKLTFDDEPTDGSTNPVTSEGIYQAFLKSIYPVGSIYMSVLSTSPAVFLGGTWERIEDTFLLAAGTTYTAGATGGEAAHTLTINEMPSHGHPVYVWDNAGTTGNAYYYDGATKTIHSGARLYNSSASSWKASGSTASAADEGRGDPSGGTGLIGNDVPHNNMPPYLAVYIWKRTA